MQRVKGRVPIVMHIGTANTLSSIDLAKHAVSLGVDAVAVVPPYYYPHDDWEVYAHYKAIARAVPGTPMFIYDNTETTWVEITPAKANKIIEAIAPNPLAGIKVSFIPYDKLLGYVYQLPKSVGVFPGGIFNLYTGYSVGVHGAIHPPSTPFPEPCVKMYEALKSGDLKGAQKEHDHFRAGVSLVGQLPGLRHQVSELSLHFLRFLNRCFLAGFYLAEITSFRNQLDRLKTKIDRQSRQRNDERHIRRGLFNPNLLLNLF